MKFIDSLALQIRGGITQGPGLPDTTKEIPQRRLVLTKENPPSLLEREVFAAEDVGPLEDRVRNTTEEAIRRLSCLHHLMSR